MTITFRQYNRPARPTLTCLGVCACLLLSTVAWASSSANPLALFNVSQRAQDFYNSAERALVGSRLDEAERGFLAAAEAAPLWGLPNGRLAIIYHNRGDVDRAMEQYQAVQAASLGGWRPEGLTDEQLKLREEVIRQEAYAAFLVNRTRQGCGLPMLAPDPLVAVVARQHSEEMRDQDYFAHESPVPGKTTVQDRFVRVFGYKPRVVGENLARRWGGAFLLVAEKILATHNDLMASRGHRENILYPTVQWLGIGIAANPKGDYWITQVFVEPKH